MMMVVHEVDKPSLATKLNIVVIGSHELFATILVLQFQPMDITNLVIC